MKPGETHLDVPATRGFQRVLVPVDFTPASLAALRYAGLLAERFGSTVCLLHVIASNPFALNDGGCLWMKPSQEMDRETVEQLSRLAREELAPELPVTPLIRRGQPVLEILRAIEAQQVDLLILAAHRRSTLGGWFSGKTSARVARHASCPVLVVHCADDACTETVLWREAELPAECDQPAPTR